MARPIEAELELERHNGMREEKFREARIKLVDIVKIIQYRK